MVSAASSSHCSVSPKSKLSDDQAEILIDFTTPRLSPSSSGPRSDSVVADEGEIPLFGPEFAETLPSADGGTFGDFPERAPPACDVTVTDDGEILLIGPDFAGNGPFDNGNFVERQNNPPASSFASGISVSDDGEILFVGPNVSGHRPSDNGNFDECWKYPPTYSSASGILVADDGEILLVGPDFTGNGKFDNGNFGERQNQPPTSSSASEISVADDGEILLVGPDFSGMWPLLNGGKFEDSKVRGWMTTNPFLPNILQSSSSSDATSCMEAICQEHDADTDDKGLQPVGGEIGRGGLMTGRGISPSFDQFESSVTTSRSPWSFHSEETGVPHSDDAAPMMYETRIDDDDPLLTTCPVTFVVSCKLVVRATLSLSHGPTN